MYGLYAGVGKKLLIYNIIIGILYFTELSKFLDLFLFSTTVQYYGLVSHGVPARHISEGAAPCPYCPNSLASCPIYIAPDLFITSPVTECCHLAIGN